MKMMKTEMEFVTFDAQDVIMTSGTPMAWFKVTRDLVPEAEMFIGSGTWIYPASPPLQLFINDDTPNDDTYWQLTGGVSRYTYDEVHNVYYIADATAVNDGAQVGTQLIHLLPENDDINAVIGWLKANGKQ